MANVAVFGIYSTRPQVEQAVDQLREAGFRPTDVSVLFPENVGTKEFAHEKHTKAPEGVAAGATSGALVGGTLGWLAGIGALAIPGIGPFIAAGPIVALLSGVGVGATIGGIAGALVGMGIPEYEAKRYEGKVKAGNLLISVHTENSEEIKRAKGIFTQAGAQDICTTGEASTPKDSKATERSSRPAEPAFSAARPH